MLVDQNRATCHSTIGLKMTAPVVIAEHDIRSAVRAPFIGGMEKTAEIRLNAQLVEVVSARLIKPG
jgi:hypothetical protein